MNIHNATSSLPYPPVGTDLSTSNSDFTQIRKRGKIYVDKTDTVLDLALHYDKIFLSRPRRFGKTLLLSTFETLFRDGLDYFAGARRLYKGESFIEEPFKIAGKWNEPRYPVVHLDFSCLRNEEKQIRSRPLEDILRDEVVSGFKRVGFRLDYGSPSSWQSQLKEWLLNACAASSIVLLIDEYDAGLGCRLHDPEAFSRVLSLLSFFFTVVKSAGRVWRFLFITGITRFSKASIFSCMNDLEDITFDPKFGTLLGYTEPEIRENFAPYLEKAALANDVDVEELLARMRKHYDGFCFDDEASTHVYAPWSVLKFLSRPKFVNYWADSGGKASVIFSYIKSGRAGFKPIEAPIEVDADDFLLPVSLDELSDEVLLNQAGYLSILDQKDHFVVLGIPNIEVATTFSKLCLKQLLRHKTLIQCGISSVAETLKAGDSKKWMDLLDTYFNSIAYDFYPVTNEAACRLLVQTLIVGSGNGNRCIAERHNPKGRSDLEVSVGKFHWVMEFKYSRDATSTGDLKAEADTLYDSALKEAVEQIKENGYGKWSLGTTRIRMAIVFSAFHRKIVRWQTVEESEANHYGE